jgi:hypothetical protein
MQDSYSPKSDVGFKFTIGFGERLLLNFDPIVI